MMHSIKVRLEREMGLYPTGEDGKFQFHKGAIRTMKKYVTTLSVNNFNSIKVRLELAVY